jgi:hypothetical protein
MTPSFLQFPTLRPGWSGWEPCRVGGAIVPSSVGLGVVGLFGKRGLKPSQNYEQRESGDVDEGPLSMGQDAGLIHAIPPAKEIVTRIAKAAEAIVLVKGHFSL